MLLNLSKTVLKMGVNMNNVFIGESSFDADDIRSHLAQHKNNKGLSDLYINPRGDIVTHGNIVIDDYIDEVFTPDNIFMLGFESVQSLNFENSCISSFNRKCHIGESLSFEYCDDLGNLDLQNIKLGSMFVSNLLFSVCKNLHTLKNVYADNRIKCELIKTDINKIHFRNISQDVIILHISKSDSFTSVKHIINGNISLLIIDECEIHELTKHNAHHVYRAEIDCTSLFSFRGVEDFDVKIKLKFYNINSVENMINLLNNNCEIIKLDSFTLEYSTEQIAQFDKVRMIMDKYLLKKNKCDYIMDCALELIENNLQHVAEV